MLRYFGTMKLNKYFWWTFEYIRRFHYPSYHTATPLLTHTPFNGHSSWEESQGSSRQTWVSKCLPVFLLHASWSRVSALVRPFISFLTTSNQGLYSLKRYSSYSLSIQSYCMILILSPRYFLATSYAMDDNFSPSVNRRAINLSTSSIRMTGKDIFITANHSSTVSGVIWNTVWKYKIQINLINIIIIALGNAPYKMLHKLKSTCSIRKNQLWTSASLSVSQVSGPTVRSLNSTGNSFQQLGPATAKALKPQSVLWLGTTRSPRTADLKADRPETAEPLVQKATR